MPIDKNQLQETARILLVTFGTTVASLEYNKTGQFW
jgi:hypothetical protein